MSNSVIDGNLYVKGRISATDLEIPNDSVGNAAIDGAAPIEADKIYQHVNQKAVSNHGSAVTAFRQVIHLAVAAGEIRAIRAARVVACTSTGEVTVDVLKNGTSVITPIVLDVSNANFEVLTASGLTATYAADDVFEVAVTVAGSTVGQGLVVSFEAYEEPV